MPPSPGAALSKVKALAAETAPNASAPANSNLAMCFMALPYPFCRYSARTIWRQRGTGQRRPARRGCANRQNRRLAAREPAVSTNLKRRAEGSVQAFAVAQPLDLVLHLQFLTLELHNLQVIDRGVGQAFVDFGFERLMLFFQFREMRLHRHAACLLNLWL